MRPALAVPLLVALLVSSIRARAAPAVGAIVTLSMLDCPGISSEEVRRIASIELKLPVTQPRGPNASLTTVNVRCSSSSAQLELVDGVTRKSVQRAVDLQLTAPLARPRLLALSVAELVSASWAELELLRAEQPPANGPAAHQARAVVKARRLPALEGEAQLLGGVRAWSSAWLSYGSAVRFQIGRPFSQRWAVLLASGIAYERGAHTEDAGTLDLSLFDAGLAALLEARFGVTRLATGVGLRGGLLRASGQPDDPTRVSGHSAQDGYFGPMLQLRTTFAPSSPLRASVGLEAGLTARAVNVRVLGEPSLSASGTWVAFTLGVGLGI